MHHSVHIAFSFSKSLSSFVRTEDSSRRSLMKNDKSNHFYVYGITSEISSIAIKSRSSFKNQLIKKSIRISHIIEFIYVYAPNYVHCG